MLPKDINNITEPVYKRLKKDIEGKPQVVDVDNVNDLSDDVLNNLKAGDVIRKKTGNQYHSYRVSYKEDGQGICLTYCDASLVETVSYDYVDGHWVYNSTDSTDIGNPPSGTKLYRHLISISNSNVAYNIYILSNNPNSLTANQLYYILNNPYLKYSRNDLFYILTSCLISTSGYTDADLISNYEYTKLFFKQKTSVHVATTTYPGGTMAIYTYNGVIDSVDLTSGNIVRTNDSNSSVGFDSYTDTVTEL